MELRPGYKQTEVGVIPEDWEAKTIDQVGFVTSGKRLPLGSSLVEQETPHPYIRVTDMRPGTVSLSDIRFVPESVFPAIKRFRIFCEDIFISVAGTLGIIGKVPRELDGANLTENADRITDITCSQDYLLHVLMSPLIQNTIASIQTVGAQPKLALTRIRKFQIPLPPTKAEQEAIAAALSDVDALIAGLDRLITKKRDLKQAAMQQLLTGQVRLPGFSGEWEVKRIAEIAVLSSERNVVGLDLPVLTCSKHLGFVDSLGYFKNQVFSEDTSTYKVIRKGQIGYPANHVEEGSIGLQNLYQVALVSPIYVVFSVSEGIDSYFLHRVLKLDSYRQRFKAATTSSVDRRGSLRWPAFSEITVSIPPLIEQTAIAAILSDMDAEIAALEARRDKTRLLKQGMMQELLTGRVRLV